jgi:hypothetical protein
LENHLPRQQRPLLVEHFDQAYEVDPQQGIILEAIQEGGCLKQISVAGYTEEDVQVLNREKWNVPE